MTNDLQAIKLNKIKQVQSKNKHNDRQEIDSKA